jgi:hypothetical protein
VTDDAEMMDALARHGGFRMLPLLNTVGNRVGLHFHRFVGGELEIVQAWNSRYAALTRLPNVPDFHDPFREVPPLSHSVNTFSEVVHQILYADSPPAAHTRHDRQE